MNFLVPHSPKNKIQTSYKGNLLDMRFLCKDMCQIKGFKTSCGNPDFYKHTAEATENAPFLEKILNEGAILEGITICDEFFYSIIGENIHYGTPRNKNAPNCVPGGSSSGSAAALTQINYDFTIGTDTGGSVRVPASFCGIYGFRPTHGRINLNKVYPMSESFDTLGWFSNNKSNMLKVGKVFFDHFEEIPIEQKNILIPIDIINNLDENIKSQFYDYCENKFKNLKKVQLSKYNKSELAECFRVIQGYEIKLSMLPWIQKYNPKISTEINSRFEVTKNITVNMYNESINLRKEFVSELDKNLSKEALIIFPTTPFSAPITGQSDDDLSELRKKVMEFTCIGGLSSRPQISIPKFKGSTGPIGLSVLGNKNADEIILNNLNLF